MPKICEICGLRAHGFHFEVFSCRACAAFFRRALKARKEKITCKLDDNCSDFSGEKFPQCKSCRVKKCIAMGMKPKNIQCNKTKSITPTMEQFVGRPSIVMFKSSPSSKNYNFIDVTGLISQAAHILQEGAPILFNPDLSQLRRLSQGNVKLPNNYKKLKFIGEKHVHHIWKSELLATARWLICFDEFTKMAPKLQMQLLQSVWHVNARIKKVIKTSQIWQKIKNNFQIVHLCNEFYIELENTKFDVSWMTSYPFEQIKGFLDGIDDNCKIEELMKTIRDLKLTEVEVTYMAAQLCFQYAQARFPRSEISEACERSRNIGK
ncbi:unnamed protein product [Caenorhabditis brenneri]